MFEKTYSCYH